MQKHYEELLATLEKAASQAKAINVQTSATNIHRTLDGPIRECRAKIASYRDRAAREAAEQQAAKAKAAEEAAKADAESAPKQTAAPAQAQHSGSHRNH